MSNTHKDDKMARRPFERPRLIRNEAWTLENITANIGGFFSDSDKGHHTPIRKVRRVH